ncbi:MAG: hypothetical protein LUQ50_06705 [Methanospirillum sp.]|uniref:hypothetical protein n=1 Tax=Methanospirillum sp. TaxID=45200 RepID=UPI00236D4A8E|nr:hypothetical protein [Methanospirillum sp.]MDD1728744.1 hypothetical protein [Methanospirillum sp.]
MNDRYRFIMTFLLVSSLIVSIIPAVIASGTGAGFGDYGDFGVSESGRMATNPYYSGVIAGNVSATSSTPRVMTPLPTATPVQVNTTHPNTTITENSSHVPSVGLVNLTDGETAIPGKNNTTYSSIGEMIRAGDWDALDAYQVQKRNESSAFFHPDEVNQSSEEKNSLKSGEDDSTVTIVYPCP